MLQLLLFVSCSIVAPKYNVSYENISHLRNGNYSKIRVGIVSKEDSVVDEVDKLQIRAAAYLSPYGTFSLYLKEALEQELQEAKILDINAEIVLNAFIIKNDISTPMDKGSAVLDVRYQLLRGEVVVYDQIKSSSHVWNSAFNGNEAIGNASQNYPKIYQKNLNSLFTDIAFLNSIKGE